MKKLNFDRPLSANTVQTILTYLERRPLGEVYGLFQKIVEEITEDGPENGKSNHGGFDPADTGGRDADKRDNRFPAVET